MGFDNSYACGSGYSFAAGPFTAIGYNMIDIQSLTIPGAEWDGVAFSIWEGNPSVRAGSEFTYYDLSNHPDWDGVAQGGYWGDSNYDPVTYSIDPGQGFVLENAAGYDVTIAKPYTL